jgi:hypothetical protein
MKRLAAVLAALVFLSSAAYAQDRYYYSDERKIPIEQAEKWKVIQIPETAQAALTSALSRRPDVRLRKVLNADRGFYWLEAEERQALSLTTINQLTQQVPVRRTVPAPTGTASTCVT